MKKIIIVLFVSVLFITGCLLPPKRELSPEQQKIRSLSNTEGCEIIKPMYFEVLPYNLSYWVAVNTQNAGGNAYKIINTHTFWSQPEQANRLGVNIEVYKCK